MGGGGGINHQLKKHHMQQLLRRDLEESTSTHRRPIEDWDTSTMRINRKLGPINCYDTVWDRGNALCKFCTLHTQCLWRNVKCGINVGVKPLAINDRRNRSPRKHRLAVTPSGNTAYKHKCHPGLEKGKKRETEERKSGDMFPEIKGSLTRDCRPFACTAVWQSWVWTGNGLMDRKQ